MRIPGRQRLAAAKSNLTFAGWGFADQALSSASNFGAGVVAARSSSAAEFGAFSVAFATAVIGVGIVRSLISEVYSVRYSGSSIVQFPGTSFDPDSSPDTGNVAEWVEIEEEEVREGGAGRGDPVLDVDSDTAPDASALDGGGRQYPHAGGAWGAALLISLVASALCAVAVLLTSGALRASLIVLVFGLPFLVLQDVARYICIARRDSFGASISDGTWVVTFALAIAALYVVQGTFPGATASLGAWVFGAACATAAAALRMHTLPRIRQGIVFVRRVWRHSTRYVIDWAALGATVQLGYYVLGITAGLAVLGEFRTALLLVGPLNIVVMGAVMVLVPELTRFRRRTGNRLLLVAAGISVVLEVATILWIAVIALLPDSVLRTILGDAATNAKPLLPELLLLLSCGMLAQGPLVCLRATGDVRRGTMASLPSAPFQLLGAAVGAAVLGGASGALVGSAIGAIVSGVLGSYQLVQATKHPPIVFEQGDSADGDNLRVKASPPGVENV